MPDHLKAEELVPGNALVEAATYAAILAAGGRRLGGGRGAIRLERRRPTRRRRRRLLCVLAVIPATGVGAPGFVVDYNPWTATRKTLSELRADDRQWVGATAVSWFWMVGAITLSLVPVIIKARIGGGVEVETAITLVFAVGVAAGSMLAAVLRTAASSSRRRPSCC